MPNISAPGDARRPLVHRMVIALLITGAFTVVAWLFLEVLFVSSIWPEVESPPLQGEAVSPASLGTPNPVHAPSALAASVREPMNTWSCLAFIFVAGLFVQRSRDALARWLAVTVGIAGVCAMLYHASASRTFRSADIAGLYATCGLLAVVTAVRLGALGPGVTRGIAAFLTWLGMMIVAIGATLARNTAVAEIKPLSVPVVSAVAGVLLASMLLIYCLRRADPRKWRFGLGAIALIGVGFIFAAVDHPGGAWVNPGGFLQPHALWHVCCAAGLGLALECLNSPTRPIA